MRLFIRCGAATGRSWFSFRSRSQWPSACRRMLARLCSGNLFPNNFAICCCLNTYFSSFLNIGWYERCCRRRRRNRRTAKQCVVCLCYDCCFLFGIRSNSGLFCNDSLLLLGSFVILYDLFRLQSFSLSSVVPFSCCEKFHCKYLCVFSFAATVVGEVVSDVYAIGDCAVSVHTPLPQTAQVCVVVVCLFVCFECFCYFRVPHCLI